MSSLCIYDTTKPSELPLCSFSSANSTILVRETVTKYVDKFDCRMRSFQGDIDFVCPFECYSCKSLQLNCEGTPWYNSSEENWNNCTCWNTTIHQNYTCRDKATSFTPLAVTEVVVGHELENIVYPTVSSNPLRESTNKRRSLVDHITFNMPEIILQIPEDVKKKSSIAVSWVYLVHSGWFDCEMGAECSEILERNMFTSAGSLIVRVFIDDILDNTQTFHISPTDVCFNVCIFCHDFFQKYDCQPTWAKGLLWFIIIFVTIILAVIIFYIVRAFSFCCPNAPVVVNAAPVSMDYSKWADDFKQRMNSIKTKFNKQQLEDEYQMSDINEESSQEAPAPYPTRVPSRGKSGGHVVYASSPMVMNPVFVLSIISLIFVCQAQFCTNSVMIESASLLCTVNNTHETCEYETTALAILPYLGSVSCINLQSKDTGLSMGTLYLGYSALYKDVSLQHNYYTSSWTALSASSRSCYNADNCGAGECANYNGTPRDKNMVGAPAALFPGRSMCDAQCGCAGCGCFFCDSSCVYSRYAFQPKGSVAQVLTPFATQNRPLLSYGLSRNAVAITGTLDMTSGSIEITPGITVTVLGTLDSSDTEFGSRKIIVHSGKAYLGAACETNGPGPGLPGDIQSPSIAGLQSPTPTSFLYSNTICVPQTNMERTTFLCRPPGLDLLTVGQYTPFPGVIADTLYTYNNGLLSGYSNSPPPLLLSLSFDSSLNFSRRVNVVCPDIKEGFVAGCFTCVGGFQIVIQAKSLCLHGVANVKLITPNNITLHTTTVSLTNEYTEYIIALSSGQKYIEGLLTITYGTHKAEHYFRATLNNPVGVVLVNDTIPDGWEGGDNGSGAGFSDWFANLPFPFNIVKWVVLAVCIAVVIGLIAFIGYFIVYKRFVLKEYQKV